MSLNTNTAMNDMVANLLAGEDLHVVRSNVSTAVFNIQTRELTIPNWDDLSHEVEQMLIAHEVGHALYTSMEYAHALRDNAMTQFPQAMSYCNIIEDARIERLIKAQYPGLRKVFGTGYAELNQKDFFKLANENVASFNLIDRINLYFKLGSLVNGLSFTKDEYVFIDRIKSAMTIEDVIRIARDVYDYSLTQQQKELTQSEKHSTDVNWLNADDDTSESFDYDSDTQESDLDESESNNSMNQKSDSESESGDSFDSDASMSSAHNGDDSNLESKTADAFNSSLNDHLSNIEKLYFSLNNTCAIDIVPFKTVYETASTVSAYAYYIMPMTEKAWAENDTFIRSMQTDIAFMVKEFRQKQSASNYAKNTISKTGSLNANKLWAYQLSDNLFKSVTVTHNGEKHGVMFLLDWSSSMDPMEKTIDQLVNLVAFCRAIQIPFQVLAFRSYMDKDDTVPDVPVESGTHGHIVFSHDSVQLLELFNHTMTKSEYSNAIALLRCRQVERAYPLSETPLNQALVYMLNYLPQFKKRYQIEKLVFVTLTDGQSGHSTFKKYHEEPYGSSEESCKYGSHTFLKYKNKTYKVYEHTSMTITLALMNIIKDNIHCTNIGFYLCTQYNSINAIASYLRRYLRVLEHTQRLMKVEKIDYYSMQNDMTVNIKRSDERFCSFPVHGYDKYFFIGAMPNTQSDKELNIKKTTTRVIASNFLTYCKQKRSSRVLLSNIIAAIA